MSEIKRTDEVDKSRKDPSFEEEFTRINTLLKNNLLVISNLLKELSEFKSDLGKIGSFNIADIKEVFPGIESTRADQFKSILENIDGHENDRKNIEVLIEKVRI